MQQAPTVQLDTDDLRRQIRTRRDELSMYAQLYFERFRVRLKLATLCAEDDTYTDLVTQLAARVSR